LTDEATTVGSTARWRPAPRVAVVGTGFGARVHVPALRAAGFDVAALVGRDVERTERRARRLEIDRACTSLTAALEGGVEAVTIATPPDTHCALALEAIACGAAVLCEKPFALDAAEARAMLDAADAAGVVHLVGHEFRLAEDRAVVTRAVARGVIGRPRLIVIAQAVPLVGDPAVGVTDWWFDQKRGGGWLGASGSHVIDCVRAWTGAEFASISAALPRVSMRSADRADDSFSIRATLSDGCEVVVAQTAAGWGHDVGTTFVAGTHGTLWIDDGCVMAADRDGTRVLAPEPDLRVPPVAISDRASDRFTHLELGPYTRLCEAFLARVEGRPRAEPVPIATFADGLATTLVLDTIRGCAESARAAMPFDAPPVSGR